VLGKIAAMQTDTTSEPTGSLVPKAMPEPIRSRNPANRVGARLLSALRGDKYMVGAYAPDWPGAAPPSKEPRTTPAVSGTKGR
jgi:hypothetical protein